MSKKFKKEQRKFVRIQAHHLLKYKVVDSEEAARELSFARNVSAGGVLFYADKKIPPGKLVELEINLPEHPTIKVVAKVVRVVSLKKIGGFEMGAEFVNIDDGDRKFMDEKIKAANSQSEKGRNKTIKSLSSIAFVCGIGLAVVLVVLRFLVILPIVSMSWLEIVQACLLFSIAFGILSVDTHFDI